MASTKVAIKVVIVGDGTCGKTSLLFKFARDEFPENYVPTGKQLSHFRNMNIRKNDNRKKI